VIQTQPIDHLKNSPRQRRSRKKGSSLAEFGPVLIILVLVIILPLLNLLAFVAGYAAVASITDACASEAANSASFSDALVNLKKKAIALTDSGLGKFARVKPSGGYQNCGVDLYIATTSMAGSRSGIGGHFYGPNSGLPAQAAEAENFAENASGTSGGNATGNSGGAGATIFEYTVRSNFTVGPFMDLSHVPFVGDVPLIGKGVLLSPSTSRVIEHCDDLTLSTQH
jgi:hypothetical protein